MGPLAGSWSSSTWSAHRDMASFGGKVYIAAGRRRGDGGRRHQTSLEPVRVRPTPF